MAEPQVFSLTATPAGATKLNRAHLIFAVQDLGGKLQAAISAINLLNTAVSALQAAAVSAATAGSALGSMACTEILVQADPANTAIAFVGGASNQTIKLSAGAT
jgi:hypothetical protein